MATGRTRLIKKYANRKLYDTEDRRYVTRDVVMKLVGEGVAVTVIDQVTGADITTAVLTSPGKRAASPAANPARGADASLIDVVRTGVAGLMRTALTIPAELSNRGGGSRTDPLLKELVAVVADLAQRVDDLEQRLVDAQDDDDDSDDDGGSHLHRIALDDADDDVDTKAGTRERPSAAMQPSGLNN